MQIDIYFTYYVQSENFCTFSHKCITIYSFQIEQSNTPVFLFLLFIHLGALY